jgi:hypothetical protein
MYHIDYLTGRGCRRERLFERCNATLLGLFHSEYDAVEGSAEPW